ncbi:MAG: FlgD immunoglobulin-like domain containing protein [Methanosarcinaceae archaeon]
MKNIGQLSLVIFFSLLVSASLNFARDIEFFIARFDYQTLESKNLYYLSQPEAGCIPQPDEELYGNILVRIYPAGDFGNTLMRSAVTGDSLYFATTVWAGAGKHFFPPPEAEIDFQPVSNDSIRPRRIDFVDFHFKPGDYDRIEKIKQHVLQCLPLDSFNNQPFGLLIYAHFFSIGLSDPTTAEWIGIAYALSECTTPASGRWTNISHNLERPYMLTIAPHSTLPDSMFIGTKQGAFSTSLKQKIWNPASLGLNNPCISVSALENVRNPYVLQPGAVDVLYLGTTEYTMIPEDLNGRIFKSFNNGISWDDAQFPSVAVTAIAINPQNPESIFAAAYNPFYQQGGLFRLTGGNVWQALPFPKLESDSVTTLFRINSITIDPADTNKIFLGTEHGLFSSTDDGQNWQNYLNNFNIISVIAPATNCQLVYAATSGTGRSDGIYISKDGGANWEVFHWRTRIKSLTQALPHVSNMMNFYFSAEDQGVYAIDCAGRIVEDLTANLQDKKFTALAVDSRIPHQLYAGTQSGIYKFEPSVSTIDLLLSSYDISYQPLEPTEADTVTIFVKIHNASKIPVRNVDVLISIMPNSADSPGSREIVRIKNIPADTFAVIKSTWVPYGMAGKHQITISIDPFNTICEKNEQNNQARIFIKIAPEIEKRVWQDISKNISGHSINDLALHPFHPHAVYCGTNHGAFYFEKLPHGQWNPVAFCETKNLNVTQICAKPHPFLDWTEPVLYVGTEEYTAIPEDRLGRIFRSADGGRRWFDFGVPPIAVSAIEPKPTNSLIAYAGLFNPFYYQDGFVVLKDSTWDLLDLTPGDSMAIRINCISVDAKSPNPVLVGTNKGLYRLIRDGMSWEKILGFNIVSLIRSNQNSSEIYAATGGRSKSDGIYLSPDAGKNWQILHWHTEIVAMTRVNGYRGKTSHFYFASNFDGVFESRDNGRNWKNISEGLPAKKFLCLAADQWDLGVVYLGTPKGIYMFAAPSTGINLSPDNPGEQPVAFTLRQNYPNPFNQSTIIEYFLPAHQSLMTVKIRIFNLLGQEIFAVEQPESQPGKHQFQWDGTDDLGRSVESGVYFLKVQCGEITGSQKMVLIR